MAEYTGQWMDGGGEMGAQIRSYPWQNTPLGDPSTWPVCILASLSICLNSGFPISIYWGKDYHLLYNDAYRVIAGDKHPHILGQPRSEAWPESWDSVKPQFDAVINYGKSIRNEDRRFLIQRFGFVEECYFDYTLSPIKDENGDIRGIFNAVMETTSRVISQRRIQFLQRLTTQLHSFKTADQAYREAITLMQQFSHDIPFSLLYRYHPVSGTFSLTQSAGIAFEEANMMEWPLAASLVAEVTTIVDHVAVQTSAGNMSSGQHTGTRAMIIPIRQADGSFTGILVAGLNTAIRLDDNYKQFMESVAFQIGLAINNGISFEKERQTSDRIRYSEDQLQFAIDAAGLGTWDLDPVTNRFSGNSRLKSWFGLPPDAEIDLQLATNVISESDRSSVIAAIQKAMTYSSGGDYEIEYTILNPLNATAQIVKAKGKALFNNNQEVSRFSGTLQDITEEKKIQAALERAFEQARLSKEAAQLGTFDMDLVKGTLEWDARCRLLFGISHQNDVTYESDFLPGLHEADRENIGKIINRTFIKSESNGDFDVEYRTVGAEDQQVRWVRAKGKVFFDEQGRPLRFIGSVLEITDQKQNEIRKNDFIGMVSHELKTPLTSLKAYVQVLNSRSKAEGNSFAISSLNKVELQINKMSALINGFLNLSRLETGKIHLNMITFRMDELVNEIIEESLLVMSTHKIQLLPCDCLSVHADRDKIGQVITNLISNAVKYSPRGKLVELECKMVGNTVQVSVSDEGMGIRPQDKDRLFERFYRVESTHTENISGFGIGLYLSAEIVHRHNGKIWLESEKGVGSTFFFSLPV